MIPITGSNASGPIKEPGRNLSQIPSEGPRLTSFGAKISAHLSYIWHVGFINYVTHFSLEKMDCVHTCYSKLTQQFPNIPSKAIFSSLIKGMSSIHIEGDDRLLMFQQDIQDAKMQTFLQKHPEFLLKALSNPETVSLIVRSNHLLDDAIKDEDLIEFFQNDDVLKLIGDSFAVKTNFFYLLEQCQNIKESHEGIETREHFQDKLHEYGLDVQDRIREFEKNNPNSYSRLIHAILQTLPGKYTGAKPDFRMIMGENA